MKYIKSIDQLNEDIIDDAIDWIKDKAHILLPIAEIGSMFIPVIGPFMAMGFGLSDAALYAKEGDRTAAGITAVLSILPGVGSIVKKIPGIKTLGKEGMEALAKKAAGKEAGSLSKLEKEVIEDIGKNSKLVKKEVAKNLEYNAANRFNPKACALKMIKENLQFISLNEDACDSGWKMVQLATHDPGKILNFRSSLYTTGNSPFKMLKTFKGQVKSISGSRIIDTRIINKLKATQQEIERGFVEVLRKCNGAGIPFKDLPTGEMVTSWKRLNKQLDLDLANKLITKKEWIKKTYKLNDKAINVMSNRKKATDVLISDGQRLKQVWNGVDAPSPNVFKDPFSNMPSSNIAPKPKSISTPKPQNTSAIKQSKINVNVNNGMYQGKIHNELETIKNGIIGKLPSSREKEIVNKFEEVISEYAKLNVKGANSYTGKKFREKTRNLMGEFQRSMPNEYRKIYDIVYDSDFTRHYEILLKSRR